MNYTYSIVNSIWCFSRLYVFIIYFCKLLLEYLAYQIYRMVFIQQYLFLQHYQYLILEVCHHHFNCTLVHLWHLICCRLWSISSSQFSDQVIKLDLVIQTFLKKVFTLCSIFFLKWIQPFGHTLIIINSEYLIHFCKCCSLPFRHSFQLLFLILFISRYFLFWRWTLATIKEVQATGHISFLIIFIFEWFSLFVCTRTSHRGLLFF